MLRKICLHGELAQEFGSSVEIDVASCAEAVRALCAMRSGMREHLQGGAYRIVRGTEVEREGLDLDVLHFGLGPSVKQIHIIPVAVGGKDEGGFAKVIIGTLLIAASFAIPGSTTILGGKSLSGMVASAGLSVALGGVGMLLTNQDQDSSLQEQSDLFSGSPNQAVPGSAIPVVLGEVEVDIKIISSAIHLEDRV